MKIFFSILALIIILGTSAYFFLKDPASNDNTPPAIATSTQSTSTQAITPAEILVVVPEKSTLTWTGNKIILKNWIDQGTIKIKSGELSLSEAGDPISSTFVVDMTSIKVEKTGMGAKGIPILTKVLTSPEWFNSATFTASTFVAKNVVKNSDGTYALKGDLTIKDKTNPQEISGKLEKSGDIYTFVGKAEVDRTLYEIRFGSTKFFDNLGDGIVADNFTLDFKITFASVK
ncbi:MAG: YceI family protein [Candidatus Harrisonbacteria bacterium]|nr:YceI family protein [Candidatus Harrisonbacteria bacterium]